MDAAFREAVRANLRRRLARRIATGDGVDLGPDVLEAVRPPR
jgi:Arc/MetJ family transcription regulator